MGELAGDMRIHYQLTFTDGQSFVHEVFLSGQSPQPAPAAWTQLGFHQCTHCPLSSAEVAASSFAE